MVQKNKQISGICKIAATLITSERREAFFKRVKVIFPDFKDSYSDEEK